MYERMWGRKARNEGLPRSKCPYTGLKARQDWLAGWDEADAVYAAMAPSPEEQA